MSICVYPIPRGLLLSFKPLYFLLNKAISVKPYLSGNASLIILASLLNKVAKIRLINKIGIANIVNRG